MQLRKLLGIAFGASLLMTVPIGCAGTNQMAGAPPARLSGSALTAPVDGARRPRAKRNAFVYNYYSLPGDGSIGREPDGSLIAIGTMLYGTADQGGTQGMGTVFAINYQLSPSSVAVLHNSSGGGDGTFPQMALLPHGQWLYGTTNGGGANNDGTVFRLKTTGGPSYSYSTRWSFGPDPKPYLPQGSLINVNGRLWGTTFYAGSNHLGAIYYMPNPYSSAIECYSFSGADGDAPAGSLTKVGSYLYGTTVAGGLDSDGTIFKLDPTNCSQLVWVYSFGSQTGDGSYPNGGLVKVGNKLYGTTRFGGANGKGTIFSVGLSGPTPVEQPIYSFVGGTSGQSPTLAPVIANGNYLFGTTFAGGGTGCGGQGCGTVFQYVLPGPNSYSTLHTFQGTDGEHPEAALVLDPYDAGLYGTTLDGGANGFGTVFSLVCPSCQ